MRYSVRNDASRLILSWSYREPQSALRIAAADGRSTSSLSRIGAPRVAGYSGHLWRTSSASRTEASFTLEILPRKDMFSCFTQSLPRLADFHEQNQAMADAVMFILFRRSAAVLCSAGWELVDLSQAQ
jgi:hypothetical protein